MNLNYSAMRNNVSMLGTLLGETIEQAAGTAILERVELIRKLSKSSRAGCEASREQLLTILQNLSSEELLPVARAFSQFLNLANVAEQYQTISPHATGSRHPELLQQSLLKLKTQHGVNATTLNQALRSLSLDLVLTAHPTEITRRTLIHKLVEVNHCLKQLDHDDLSDYDRHNLLRRLRQLLAQAWYTDEIRQHRPSPVDEAKWGFAVIENSLWEAVPLFVRDLHEQVKTEFDLTLPLDFVPVQFTSWMGGDRDGNPNVTAAITEKVLLLSRWKAADLLLKDINVLISELSMSACTIEVKQLIEEPISHEPYRQVLKGLRQQLTEIRCFIEHTLQKQPYPVRPPTLTDVQQLWMPLYNIYQSLCQCGMKVIANGSLLDTLIRIKCFGLTLVKLDIRQESIRHTETLSAITLHLGLGDYQQWPEEDKQAFLFNELSNPRPLLPASLHASPEVQEVLETCRVIAKTQQGAISSYIISMAHYPSDVLAVHLLLKEAGLTYTIPIVPLFETLDDLNNASQVMKLLVSNRQYRELIGHRQMVMIGYSDSAKDAGVMAASWAQYQAQEALIQVCKHAEVALTLFHGRGGSIGRGGAPAHAALLSQPPGSLQGGLRVTEQGEMIRFKYGLPEVAVTSLSLYTSAILEANLLPPPEPRSEWRDVMQQLSADACAVYRRYVREHADFVDYFRSATPEQELSQLPLGSRPAKRRPAGGIESLRAIPWIFAWTQNRLMLPAWLGAGAALHSVIQRGQQDILEKMCKEWPFFATRIGMLEMVFAKADLWLAEYYDQRLVAKNLWPLGQQLRQQLSDDIQTVLAISNDKHLMADHPWIAESIALRNIYTDPLHVLQVELLYRARQAERQGQKTQPLIEQALMVTMTGIAAGMRNTG